jgi:hypothetical protein
VAVDFGRGRFLLPALITVTLARPGAGLTRTVARVQEQQEASADVLGGAPALLEGTDTALTLWAAELGGMVPAKDDRITRADGRAFTVTGVDRAGHGARHRCHCREDV